MAHDIGVQFNEDLEFVVSVLCALCAMFFTVFVLSRLRYTAHYMGLGEAPRRKSNKK